MVSNIDQIYSRIRKEAELLEREHGVMADVLATLVMEIVDLEDRNRVKPLGNINQQVANMIDQAGKTDAGKQDV